MSDTTNLKVTPEEGWKIAITSPIGSAGGVSGVMSMSKGGQYCQSDDQPDNSFVGHRFTGKLVPFSLNEGETIYVKTGRNSSYLIITED